mmetsp:Transcript_24090/g.68542  ORF Transcript_24090/g.68542 Transcript_24090/m.68542 type:complete len:140 (-) Transcript_24090:283-702(-)
MQMPVDAAMQMSTVARGVRRASRDLRKEKEQALGTPARREKLNGVQVHHIGGKKGQDNGAQTADLEFAYDVGLDMRDFGGERFDICSEASDVASPSTRCSEELVDVDFLCLAEAPPSTLRRRRFLARFREELVALVCAR